MMDWKTRATILWGILDDIDTADDIANGNERLYRNMVRRHHKKRFRLASSDGYSLDWGDVPSDMLPKEEEVGVTTYMEESRQQAAQCWCDQETKQKTMDPVLAEAVAKRIAAWMETAAQYCRNADYYRGLVQKCGEVIGQEAYTQDDGGIVTDVLCAKVPELVERKIDEIARLREAVKVRDAESTWTEYTNERVPAPSHEMCFYCKQNRMKHAPDCPTVTHPLEPK
jgi:hypothetical protein